MILAFSLSFVHFSLIGFQMQHFLCICVIFFFISTQHPPGLHLLWTFLNSDIRTLRGSEGHPGTAFVWGA